MSMKAERDKCVPECLQQDSHKYPDQPSSSFSSSSEVNGKSIRQLINKGFFVNDGFHILLEKEKIKIVIGYRD